MYYHCTRDHWYSTINLLQYTTNFIECNSRIYFKSKIYQLENYNLVSLLDSNKNYVTIITNTPLDTIKSSTL